MCSRDGWRAYETKSARDELRDACLVYHFHLDSGRKKGRSAYRWFAFRDPARFGNVWFNLGGTYAGPNMLRSLWTSHEWMRRIKELFPEVAVRYWIRGCEGFPVIEPSRHSVSHLWREEQDRYPAVQVEDGLYLSAGGRAQSLDLDQCDPDGWSVFVTWYGLFAEQLEPNGERILARMKEASEVADRLRHVAVEKESRVV